MKNFLRDLTPPIIWRSVNPLTRLTKPLVTDGAQLGKEQPAKYYDQTFEQMQHWKSHYTASHYYPLWTVVADRIRSRGGARILDIGCGPGQVACLMRDTPGVSNYIGVDFSGKRIAQAKSVCPEFEFQEVDVFNSDVFDTTTYDTVLVMEFLEHVENDLLVLQQLRKGSYILATVPNFTSQGHVRFFKTADEVRKRYSNCVNSLRVDTIIADDNGKQHFIFEGFTD